jgi:hypothetical protein
MAQQAAQLDSNLATPWLPASRAAEEQSTRHYQMHAHHHLHKSGDGVERISHMHPAGSSVFHARKVPCSGTVFGYAGGLVSPCPRTKQRTQAKGSTGQHVAMIQLRQTNSMQTVTPA